MAYPFDDEESDDAQTPDLQASAGLSYGGTTPQLMEMLQRMGPSPSQLTGQALAGGVAFARGQANPVTPIINQQMVQQNQIMDMIQRMGVAEDLKTHRQKVIQLGQERLKDAQTARTQATDKASFDMMLGLVKDTNTTPELLAMAMPQVASLAKKMYNVDLPNSFMQRTMDEKEQNSVMKSLALGMQPELILKNNPKLSPDDLPKYGQVLQQGGDDLLKSLGLQTKREREREILDDEIKRVDLYQKLLPPGMANTAPNADMARAKAQELFPEVDLLQLDRKQQKEITRGLELDKKTQEIETFRQKEQIKFQSGLAQLQARQEGALANALAVNAARVVQGPKPLTPTMMTKELKPFLEGANLIRQIRKIQTDLEGIPDDALPQGDDLLSMKIKSGYRALRYPGQTANFALLQSFLGTMGGAFDRGFMGERGQSIKLQTEQLKAMGNLPSKKTLNDHFNNTQKQVMEYLEDQLATKSQDAGYPEALTEEAKKILGRVAPKAKGVEPSAPRPLAPPIEKIWMDMRPGSKNYGKPVKLRYDVGDDPASKGYMEITP